MYDFLTIYLYYTADIILLICT